jgi:hypothetical protein
VPDEWGDDEMTDLLEPLRQCRITSCGAAAFGFRFAPAYQWLGAPFGIGPDTAQVTLSGDGLDCRFGPWRVRTPLANVASTSVTGPYRFVRTAGMARFSLPDHGITFATNGAQGVRIAFHEPVTGLEPTRSLRHPHLTVTVADVDGLAQLLVDSIGTSPAVPLRRGPVRSDGTATDDPGHRRWGPRAGTRGPITLREA